MQTLIVCNHFTRCVLLLPHQLQLLQQLLHLVLQRRCILGLLLQLRLQACRRVLRRVVLLLHHNTLLLHRMTLLQRLIYAALGIHFVSFFFTFVNTRVLFGERMLLFNA